MYEREREENKKEKAFRKKNQKAYVDSLAKLTKVHSLSTVFNDIFAHFVMPGS
jgi:hypothetical protein